MLKQVVLGDYIIPISYIDSVSIIESIYSHIATGIIVLSDSGFVEKLLKYKEFNINFLFGDNNSDTDYLLSFNVHSFDVIEYDLVNKITNKRILKFSSHYSIKLMTDDIYLNYYDKSSSEMIRSICNIANLKINKINDTNTKWNYVSPNWNLSQSINYIIKNTIDDNSNGGFLFFPDIFSCRVNFLNYYDLISGKIGINNTPLLYDSANDSYLGNIIDIKIIKQYNLLRELSRGLNNTNIVGFDPNTGKIINDKNDITKIINANDKLYGYLPIDQNDIQSGVNIEILPLFSENYIKSIKSMKYNDMLYNQLAFEILCNGDYNRRLGQIIPIICNVFAESDEIEVPIIDKKLSGSFIISDIEHIWIKNQYQQKLKTIKSGYSIIESKNLIKLG